MTYLKKDEKPPTDRPYVLIKCVKGVGGTELTQHSLGITIKMEPKLLALELPGLIAKGVPVYVKGAPDAEGS